MTLFSLNDLSNSLIVANLSASWKGKIEYDNIFRLAQVITTFILFIFYCYWILFAARNMISLFEDKEHSAWLTFRLSMTLLMSSLKMTRIINKMRFQCVPNHLDHQPTAWLLPVWWTMLFTSSVAKLLALYFSNKVQTVGDLRVVYFFTITAFAIYPIFYFQTVLILKEITWLQALCQDNKERTGSPI
ncbi:MAG: hypothetical protein P1U57_01100 [Oleibacter sp.]|nr:hypothetical protein [Thalassolituus sp.]